MPQDSSGGPWPVVCVVHGGYYRARYDLTHIGHLAAALTEDGFATWTIEYRRLGQIGGGWPGTFLDVGAGLDFLRELAQNFPLDLSRVVPVGHSAGGQLALWLASRPRLTPDALPVTGVVALAPVADLARAWELRLSNHVVDELMGGSPTDVPERYARTSPLQLVPIGVPQIVIHGTADTSVPYELSAAYVQAAGDEAELVTLNGVDHFDPIDPRTPAFSATRTAVRRLAR